MNTRIGIVSTHRAFSPALIEGCAVLLVLVGSAYYGGEIADWLSCGAVFLSFLCTQAAFDLADANERLSTEPQSLGRRHRQLYLAKECFWIATCLALKNSPLIVSTVLFATYPYWRRRFRLAFAVGDTVPERGGRVMCESGTHDFAERIPPSSRPVRNESDARTEREGSGVVRHIALGAYR